MRRTVLSAMALASAAVLASAMPAFADDASPSQAPSTPPTAAATPAATPSVAPADGSAEPTTAQTPSAVPPKVKAPGQVAVVPEGAPDTGVASASGESGSADGVLIGTGAAALFAGGATVFVVRRRRATGA
ncbi:Tat pathway signal sequence domain protein [Streptomyces sp. PSRA5]|uniref:sortase-dependent protein n=1 Tax=Streptomyces panacea TaxID=3035064 RepID=UPI00339C11CA